MSSSRLKRCAATSSRRPTKRGVGGSLRQLTIKIDLGSRQVTLNDRPREEDDAEKELDEEERNSWGTPDKIIRWLKEGFEPRTFRVVGDACASDENHLFACYFTEDIDAMKQDWVHPTGLPKLTTCCDIRRRRGDVARGEYHCANFLIDAWFWNGPYNKTKGGYDLTSWFAKCYREACKGVCVVMLVPAPNGTQNRWDAFVYGKASIIYDIPHRLRFKCPRTGIESKHSTARFGSQLVVFDPRMLCKDGCSELAEGDTFDTVIRPLSLEA